MTKQRDALFLGDFNALWNLFQLWHNREVVKLATLPLLWCGWRRRWRQYHLLTEWCLIICISRLRVSVMLLSGSNTWLHCQGETYRGQYTTVFRQSSYCRRLVDSCYFFSPSGTFCCRFVVYLLFSKFSQNTSSGREKKNGHLAQS